jgi:hypothetical protein
MVRSGHCSLLFKKLLVVIVGQNREPIGRVLLHASDRPPPVTDSHRPIVTLAFKAQRRMSGITLPKLKCLPRFAPNFGRQRDVFLPKSTRDRGVHRAVLSVLL